VLGYTSAVVVEDACREVPVTEAGLSNDGLVNDPKVIQQTVDALATLAATALGPRLGAGRQP